MHIDLTHPKFLPKSNEVHYLGNDLVLGPPQPLIVERTVDSGLPLEQAITRQRMRPGSGSLCLRVTTDGPTRVLQILDVNKPTTVRINERCAMWKS